MNNFFKLDSKPMRFMTKVSELMLLNVLILVCSLPIITLGASLTAGHYVALKIVRDEENYITKSFFKSFAQNFLQATGIWLILLVIGLLLGADVIIFVGSSLEANLFMIIVFALSCIAWAFVFAWAFAMLSKFENTVIGTIKNAAFISLLHFPKTILMIVITVVDLAVLLLVPELWFGFIILGVSFPLWVAAKFYNGVFEGLEYNMLKAEGKLDEQEEEDPDVIFHDEVDDDFILENTKNMRNYAEYPQKDENSVQNNEKKAE